MVIEINLNTNCYSPPLLEKIIRDARAKGGKLLPRQIAWRFDIQFDDSQVGEQFYKDLPNGDISKQ